MASENLGMLGLKGLLAKIQAQNSGNSMASANLQKAANEENVQAPAKRLKFDVDDKEKKHAALKQQPFIPPDENSSKMEVVPLSRLPLMDPVFSIEKIRTKIFALLSCADLKRSRLVSRAWQIYATNETLLNWKTNRIKIEKGKCWIGNQYCRKDQHKKSVNQLTDLMDVTGRNTFPCNSFAMEREKTTTEDTIFDNFLEKQGFRIKKMNLSLKYVLPSSKGDFKEVLFVELVTKLVGKQAPNLETLSIEVYPCLEPGLELKDLPFSVQPKSQTTTEEVTNLNLKYVTILGAFPKSLFERIIRIAPNLIQFDVECKEHLLYYLEPANRLHLCSFIHFKSLSKSLNEHEESLMNIIANMDGLALKGLALEMGQLLRRRQTTPELLAVVADTSIKLLEKCSHSLQTLVLDFMGFFLGLKIPKMKKVTCLKLTKFGFTEHDEFPYFPKGIRLSECFPNLRIIELNVPNNMINSQSFPLGSDDQSLSSVKIVMVEKSKKWKKKDIDSLQRWFPNANIENGETRGTRIFT